MIVRCIANTGASLPAANIDARRGYSESTEFPLTVGGDYPVLALTVFLGTAWYFVLDDDGNPWPTWSPSALFEIIDGSLPSSWMVGRVGASADEHRIIISFPEWATDPTFYERLVDGESEATHVFADRRREAFEPRP
jgi:hypothetical protein